MRSISTAQISGIIGLYPRHLPIDDVGYAKSGSFMPIGYDNITELRTSFGNIPLLQAPLGQMTMGVTMWLLFVVIAWWICSDE